MNIYIKYVYPLYDQLKQYETSQTKQALDYCKVLSELLSHKFDEIIKWDKAQRNNSINIESKFENKMSSTIEDEALNTSNMINKKDENNTNDKFVSSSRHAAAQKTSDEN